MERLQGGAGEGGGMAGGDVDEAAVVAGRTFQGLENMYHVCRAQGEKAAMLRAVREDHEFKISGMIVDIFNYENIVKVSKIRIID